MKDKELNYNKTLNKSILHLFDLNEFWLFILIRTGKINIANQFSPDNDLNKEHELFETG